MKDKRARKKRREWKDSEANSPLSGGDRVRRKSEREGEVQRECKIDREESKEREPEDRERKREEREGGKKEGKIRVCEAV